MVTCLDGDRTHMVDAYTYANLEQTLSIPTAARIIAMTSLTSFTARAS